MVACVPHGSAVVYVDPGRLPTSLGLWTESTNSAKGSFESAKESTYPCRGGKGANGKLERWLTGNRERGKRWANQEDEGSREKVWWCEPRTLREMWRSTEGEGSHKCTQRRAGSTLEGLWATVTCHLILRESISQIE